MCGRNTNRCVADADANSSQVFLHVGACRQDGILVGEVDSLSVTAEEMNVGAATEGTGGKGSDEIASVERRGQTGLCSGNNHAAPMAGGIAPGCGGVFWAVDKHHAVVCRACGHDAAAGTTLRFEENLHAAARHFDPFDADAVKHTTIHRRAGVVHNPAAIG